MKVSRVRNTHANSLYTCVYLTGAEVEAIKTKLGHDKFQIVRAGDKYCLYGRPSGAQLSLHHKDEWLIRQKIKYSKREEEQHPNDAFPSMAATWMYSDKLKCVVITPDWANRKPYKARATPYREVGEKTLDEVIEAAQEPVVLPPPAPVEAEPAVNYDSEASIILGVKNRVDWLNNRRAMLKLEFRIGEDGAIEVYKIISSRLA